MLKSVTKCALNDDIYAKCSFHKHTVSHEIHQQEAKLSL